MAEAPRALSDLPCTPADLPSILGDHACDRGIDERMSTGSDPEERAAVPVSRSCDRQVDRKMELKLQMRWKREACYIAGPTGMDNFDCLLTGTVSNVYGLATVVYAEMKDEWFTKSGCCNSWLRCCMEAPLEPNDKWEKRPPLNRAARSSVWMTSLADLVAALLLVSCDD